MRMVGPERNAPSHMQHRAFDVIGPQLGPIYLDMDGVLMDFESHISKWLAPPWAGRTYHYLPKSEWTEEEQANDLRYQNAMEDHTFWRTMPPMSDAHLLWNFCRPWGHHIMTATPSNATYRARCSADKLHSIHKHFDPVFPIQQFNAVLRSEKASFAKPGAILVDDMPANCKEWCEAGGTAILHTDALSTIRKLQELIHV